MRKIVFVIALIMILAPIKILSIDTDSSSNISETDTQYSNEVSLGSIRNTGGLEVAFSDNFDNGNLDPQKWSDTTGVVVNEDGKNEPSPLFSANLDGSADTLTSRTIDLDNYGYGFLEFFVEPGGDADNPEAGDYLTVEMRLTLGWRVVQIVKEELLDNNFFFISQIVLPKTAFHSNFQIKFATYQGQNGLDDWFVDNVNVTVKGGKNIFFDDFESGWTNWPVRTGSPDINAFANGIPSPTNALNLDGSGDLIESGAIDLSQETEGYLYYFVEQGYEAGGNRDEPEAFDDLQIKYYTSMSTWEFLNFEFGFEPGMDTFTLQERVVLLPPEAFHTQFKIRINTSLGQGANNDDWFVDDIGVITSDPLDSLVMFNDSFDDASLDEGLWPLGDRQGTPAANSDAQNEPSPDYSLNLDGSGDKVVTKNIDLSGATWASLTYWYEQRGGGDEPEAGDDLTIELKLMSGWKEIKRHTGGHGSNTFSMEEISLSLNAFHNGFQVRFSTPLGDGANKDDWFIDNIKVIKGLEINPSSFSDLFDNSSLDDQWQILKGEPKINERANNEPSPDASLNLDGEADMVATSGINLDFCISATLIFHWQQGNGNGNDEPEGGDDLYADILFPKGWFNIFHEKGATGGTAQFNNFTFILPKVAFHNNFKVRFRVTSTEGSNKDDWFIDNISVRENQLPGLLNIGVYHEYSDKETEGINPLKSINEVFTDYNLYLFDDYKAATDNLSQMQIFIICEQKHLTQQGAQDIHLYWRNAMDAFFENHGKVIVLDGGQGNSRLLVNSFIETTGSTATFGSIDNAMPWHPLCHGLQDPFDSPTNTAYFTGVDGRVLLTLTVNNQPEVVVAEKRCRNGSVMLFGFDYSEWNEDIRSLLHNVIFWQIENEIKINEPEINRNNVYAGLGADTITINVNDTIGPEDVSNITLEFNDTGISIVFENGQPSIQGDSNNSLTINSWHTETTVENLILNLNLTFNWNFPIVGDINVSVTASGEYLPEVNISTQAFINLMKTVSFLGELSVKNEMDELIQPGDIVGRGEELTFTGISAVYNGTIDVFPPDDQFDMELRGMDSSSWIDANSSGREISITAAVPNNASENYSFELILSGPAGLYSNPISYFHVNIDNSSPVLLNPLPEPGWHRDPIVNCSIEVVDQGGAGLVQDDIKYQFSTDDGVNWSEWLSVDSFEDGTAVKTIAFEEGKDNYMKWQASDRVGNGPIESDSINIWVDSKPVEFYDLLPVDVENSLTPTCSVCVRDAASGVDVSDVWVRQSTDAGSTWTDWDPAAHSLIDGGYLLSFVASFKEGDDNRIEWKGKDIVGNNNTTDPHTVIINTSLVIPPEVKLISPMDSATVGLEPTLRWELSKGNATGMKYRLFLDETDEIDTASNTSLISSSGASSYTFDDDLMNGTTYYWTVIPVRTEDGNDTVGLCTNGIWSFVVEEGFETLEVRLNTPADLATTNETPTLKWELMSSPEGDVTYKLFVGKSNSIDIASDADLLANLTDTFYTFDEELDNGSKYYWTVIPFIEKGNNSTEGMCLDRIWSFTVEKGFVSNFSFSIGVVLEREKPEFYAGEKVNLTITLNNAGNNEVRYTFAIDRNFNVSNMEDRLISKKKTQSIAASIELPDNLEPGRLTINLTITSLGNSASKIEKIVITILEKDGTIDDPSGNTSDGDKGFFSDIPILWVVIGIAALLLIIIIIVIIRRRGDDEWDEDDDDDYDDDDYDDDDEEEDDGVFSRIKKGDSPVDDKGQMTPGQDGAMVACEGCGKGISSGTVFCIHCGVKQTGGESKPATATLPKGSSPVEQEEDDMGGEISLDELMSRASQLIETEMESSRRTVAVSLPEPVNEPDTIKALPEKSGITHEAEKTDDEDPKKMSLDEVTSVDELLNIVIVESAPLDDDDEEVIEVVASSPLDEDEALPMPTVSVALLDDDEDEEEVLPPPALSLEDVMMEVVGAPSDIVEEDDMDMGAAPPPPPPE